jgi:hypothetical protein
MSFYLNNFNGFKLDFFFTFGEIGRGLKRLELFDFEGL